MLFGNEMKRNETEIPTKSTSIAGFAYGYRGSLLARLAVAALRWENHNVARRAIEIRHLEYRASMQPMESAAIIRGLLRIHNVTDALDIIADELSLPLAVSFSGRSK